MDTNSSTEAIYENIEEQEKGCNRRCSSFRLLLVSVAILSVLLLVSIGIICWGGWKMNQQGEAIEHLKTEHEKLQNETEKLSKQEENLNQIVKLIQKFNTFLIDDHCSGSECLLCQTGWIFFNESCYFLSKAYLTWDDSREFCQFISADLIVIDNLQEQEFIYDNMKSSYWLGLRKVGNNWFWINGRNDTLRFWYGSDPSSSDSYARLYRSSNPRASWVSKSNSFSGYPLCEQKAFKVSFN